ncbi:OmpA family protein [Pseudomonas sp. SWRI99]|uniref:OmpA family protein n=1 Tax=Pseudomonas sp. SWRI99 TaxID=2745506 RepID=UPI00164877C4|nr:OmpA family protein [Pseudomonas sp. SWRI99]MBC3776848.1 OmpA family protein [Pseudomonas sp. SWRI99]
MFKRNHATPFVLCGALLFAGLPLLAQAAPETKTFGAAYQPVAPVANDQVQVVYYRAAEAGQADKGAAHVYVDRRFHTGLLPGGYTAFCVKPGDHTLGAYLNDAPLYKGKNSDTYRAEFQGGKTYFLRVNSTSTGAPQVVARADAERELAASRVQAHALSRASTIEACRYQQGVAQQDHTLSGDVLFAFGKSGYQDITAQGRATIRELASQLRGDAAASRRIQVIGHTDSLGSEASNQVLGLKRAQTVRRILLDGGLPASAVSASSAGSQEPVIDVCRGSKSEQVRCNAPNRRVVVRVEGSAQG